jgi:hypothetical protein
MAVILKAPRERFSCALILPPLEYTLPSEHWLCFPQLSSLLLLTGPGVFTGWFPFGVSLQLPQFIFPLVILLFLLAGRPLYQG